MFVYLVFYLLLNCDLIEEEKPLVAHSVQCTSLYTVNCTFYYTEQGLQQSVQFNAEEAEWMRILKKASLFDAFVE